MKPKNIHEMQTLAKTQSGNEKYIVVPKNLKRFPKKDKEISLPTEVEIRNIEN
jgi:hypothetical protein